MWHVMPFINPIENPGSFLEGNALQLLENRGGKVVEIREDYLTD